MVADDCGVLAWQVGLVDLHVFVEACALWATCKDRLLVDLMVERGWLKQSDREILKLLLESRSRRCRRDVCSVLPPVCDEAGRSLAEVTNPAPQGPREGSGGSLSPRASPTTEFAPPGEARYELLNMHASGGIGRVWLARETSLERYVALKELRSERLDDPQATLRFLREARITGQLEHPGVTPVYELGWRDADRKPFYSMRFVKGPTLKEAIGAYHERRRAGEAASTELLALLSAFVAVCNTVAYAHSRHVVHRDLKGQNIVLGEFGEVIVLDWGLAKLMQGCEVEESGLGSTTAEDFSGNASLTAPGQALGTPAYMAPEQAAGRMDEIDHRTDIYGLGAMLYEILTGQPPFAGTNTQEILRKIQTEQPTHLAELVPDVPLPLETACLRALAKDPNDRFASASDLALTVVRWQETERKAAEEALIASEALYHSLVETIPMNVWRKDAEGRFTFANKGFCTASGRSLEEVIGKTDFDLFPPVLAEKYRRNDEWVMATGEIFDSTEEHVTGGGAKLRVRVIKLPIHDPRGHVIGTQGIFWDANTL